MEALEYRICLRQYIRNNIALCFSPAYFEKYDFTSEASTRMRSPTGRAIPVSYTHLTLPTILRV